MTHIYSLGVEDIVPSIHANDEKTYHVECSDRQLVE
jgi:hypothetical protein